MDDEIGQLIYSLGSGPLEPFSVAEIPECRHSYIRAIDNDPKIVGIVRETLEWGALSRLAVASACGDDCIPDPYRPEAETSWSFEGVNSDEHIEISKNVRSRISISEIDLCQSVPAYAPSKKLIFSGFLLVNIAKQPHAGRNIKFVLTGVRNGLLDGGGVFATCTSYHFLSNPDCPGILDYLLECSLGIEFGVMNRLAMSSHGLTSNFGVMASAVPLGDNRRRALFDSITRFVPRVVGVGQYELTESKGSVNHLIHEIHRSNRIVLAFIRVSKTDYIVYSISRNALSMVSFDRSSNAATLNRVLLSDDHLIGDY